MVQQDPHEVGLLVQALEAAKGGGKSGGKKTFSCKKSTFAVAGSDITVDSWRFMDWDYKRSDLPTYARGLFTARNRKNRAEIVVRGYDKFFNVEEVNATRWRNIETNTHGPYELSVKENGCIIFISGLEDGTLLVCSKHSTGARQDSSVSHALVGEKWVATHVESVGRDVRDLARKLREMNATAVGELCDDSFEEHVLAYDENMAGIYLHGINFNVPEFATLPSSEVHRFADEWGFKKAQFLVMDNLSEVSTFLQKCAETGSWNGRDTEGFVIRCQMSENGTGPYRDWFFKYKFEEPYLMYRQWREATKAVIAGKPPKFKKHRKITEEYLLYARRQLVKDPKIGKLYNQNHGIIAMRDGFLHERGLKGSEIIAMEREQGTDEDPKDITGNIVLVPVASLGCGKTTVALGLVKLFGWGHIQNDNIQGQKNRPRRFAMGLTNALAEHKVVIADRNNHQKRERKQIIDDVLPVVPDARFVALHYVHEPKPQMLQTIRDVTRKRVLERGDNHQTIQAGSKNPDEIVKIMEGFLHRFEGVDSFSEPDFNFDHVIDLDVSASSRENLETIVSSLHSFYPKVMGDQMPSSAELDEAVDAAIRDYSVDTKHDLSFGQKKKDKGRNEPVAQSSRPTPEQLVKKLEYFGISLYPDQVSSLLSSLFPTSTDPEKARMYRHLLNGRRIQPAFHVTLIHRASGKDSPEIWNHYADRYVAKLREKPDSTETTPTLGPARVRLERLVWDNRIMALVARILPPENDAAAEVWPCANEIPHVTVGTAAPEVKPKESNDLLKRWLEVGAGPETGIWEMEVPGVRVLEGWATPVLSRGR